MIAAGLEDMRRGTKAGLVHRGVRAQSSYLDATHCSPKHRPGSEFPRHNRIESATRPVFRFLVCSVGVLLGPLSGPRPPTDFVRAGQSTGDDSAKKAKGKRKNKKGDRFGSFQARASRRRGARTA